MDAPNVTVRFRNKIVGFLSYDSPLGLKKYLLKIVYIFNQPYDKTNSLKPIKTGARISHIDTRQVSVSVAATP